MSTATFAHAASAVPVLGSAVPALGVGGIFQAVFGLIVVIGAVFACGWLARRLGIKPTRQGGLVKVVGSASLGTRERVVVVEVADTWLVLGVAPGNVRSLHTLPAQGTVDAAAPAGATPSFQAAFARQLRAKFNVPGKD
ncbi:flagellar biosynthetic protein FliO [Robbsia sp. Bb-Pol-6]|uniref:Flagellar protein n=1 Tax=Robbsia betulipollinis TaxID=2981849 RepID=A0ABT3ZHJ1_9BURK|nr:flagellar biosynthetic protein FliO [Robbsia betulipollinis]MCY0385993.1 flagellar biosynthetic protein FliO [Robbsia betulipollinis]